MRAALAAVVLTLVLAACQTADKTVITLCSGYAVSLSALADLRVAGKLGNSAVAAIDKERAVLNPICTADTLPTRLDGPTLTSAQASLDALKNILEGVK